MKELFDRVYDVLVEAGADDRDGERFRFLNYQVGKKPHDVSEWRFCGHLGFGGKFYGDAYDFRVGCYPEDMNDRRRAIIDKANAALKPLYEEYYKRLVAQAGTRAQVG